MYKNFFLRIGKMFWEEFGWVIGLGNCILDC